MFLDPVQLTSNGLLMQYNIPSLETLALDHIRGELAKCDIVEESFSIFASQ